MLDNLEKSIVINVIKYIEKNGYLTKNKTYGLFAKEIESYICKYKDNTLILKEGMINIYKDNHYADFVGSIEILNGELYIHKDVYLIVNEINNIILNEKLNNNLEEKKEVVMVKRNKI